MQSGAFLLLVLAGSVRAEPSPALTCAGADTMQAVAERWALLFNSTHSDHKVRVRTDSRLSADGVTMMLRDEVDCVTFVREPFTSELAELTRKLGHPPIVIPVAGGSYATKSGTHALAVFVNEGNPLREIALSRLDALLSRNPRRGHAPVTRWGQLGVTGSWADRPVHVYGMLRQRESGNPPGVMNFIQQRVLLGGAFRDDLIELDGDSLSGIVQKVAEDQYGIAVSGFTYAVPGVKTLAVAEEIGGPYFAGTAMEVAAGVYPLSRQIYLLLRPSNDGKLAPTQSEFLEVVLSPTGQIVIGADRMAFLPLTVSQLSMAHAALSASKP